MTPTALLAAFLWLAPSYLIHVARHEGSHALAAVATGAKVTSFSVFPERQPSGQWFLGHMSYEYGHRRGPTPAQSFLVSTAPVLTAVAWALIANEIRRGLPQDHWLRGPLMVEVAFAATDAWNWGRGAYTYGNDAHDATQTLGLSQELAVVPALALTASLAFRW